MKYLYIYTLFSFFTLGSQAQNSFRQTVPIPNDPFDLNKYVWSHTHSQPSHDAKPIMDFNAIENDISIGPNSDFSISPDGKYFAYSIQSTTYRRRDTLVVQATTGSWRQVFAGASPGFFSINSKQYIFKNKEDLCFLQVGNGQIRYAKEVASYQQPAEDTGKWLAYQLKPPSATLIIKNLLTGTEKHFESVSEYGFDNSGGWMACKLMNGVKELLLYNLNLQKEQRFPSVMDYSFDAAGKGLIVKTITKTNNDSLTSLQYVNLTNGTINTIWQATNSTTNIGSFDMDGSGKQVVFTVQENNKNKQPVNSIWYWKIGMNNAMLKIDYQTEGIETGWLLQDPMFTDNDQYIIFFIYQQEAAPPKPNFDAVKVDVWSYKDTNLQSTQPYLLKMPPQTYRVVVSIESNQLIRLEKQYETMRLLKGDFAVVGKTGKNNYAGDRFWEKAYQIDSSWLVSLKDGTRRLLKTRGGDDYWFSPEGKYLIYFDGQQECNYFSVDLSSGKIINISAKIPAYWLGVENYYLRTTEKPDRSVGLAGWIQGENGMLVYDNYDIWQLDLSGKKSPEKLTNGYGRKNSIKLSLMGQGEDAQYSAGFMEIPVLPEKTPLLLKAFNMQNKYSGVYLKVLGSTGDPKKLCMGPYTLENIPLSTIDIQNITRHTKNITKAARANTWIVKRQTATEAPNYYLTTDFKHYQPLTYLQPQKRYNWLTAELHTFKQLDGTLSQGILYKPENFDSTQKYPAIIVFYGSLSNLLYVYPTPTYIWSPSAPAWNPGWMASHGYLVFTPDIYFTKGQWGPSTQNTIDGAARYLSSLPFVEGQRLGACGHSNSGRFGYYILTHSQSFAAMSIGAGATDIINSALSLYKANRHEASNLEWTELTSYGTALGNLWENKATWLDHTAVLQVDKITSPVLLFHNKKDGVPVEQVIEMFIALRRLEKKSWWLQYDDGYHTVKGISGKDFTIRYTQFFDHYLKWAPPPRWMTQGIPAKYKQIENRYELDPKGTCGNNCPICRPYNK